MLGTRSRSPMARTVPTSTAVISRALPRPQTVRSGLRSRSPGGTYRLRSVRRSRFCGCRATPCRRSGAGSVDPPRRSPVSCGATQPPAAVGCSIARRPPSGMPSDQPVARNRASSRSMRPCALMWRRGWPASSSLRAAFPLAAPLCLGTDAGVASDRIDDGPGHGARSRSPGACRSTFRTTRRCASATKPSIRQGGRSSPLHPRPRRVAPGTSGLLANRAGIAGAEGPHTSARQRLRLAGDHDQPASC